MTQQSFEAMAGGAGGESLEGVVERVVYASEESGWTVVRLRVEPGARAAGDAGKTARRLGGLRGPVTAVGRLLGVREGERLRLTGEWVVDKKYGRQFRADSFLSIQPKTVEGIRKYLGSGLIAGIGKVMARRLVARFGVETLEVIDREPERLAEVEGIGPVRIERIRKAWQEQRGIRDVLVFLQQHGVTTGQAVKIYRHFGAGAIAAMRDNPFRIADEIFGIGFQTADGIAAGLGVAPDAPERAAAGLEHALRRASDQGHVYLPRERLLERAAELLKVGREVVEGALADLVTRGELVLEELPQGDAAVYLPDLHAAERGLAAEVRRLVRQPAKQLEVDVERALAWVERRQGIALAAAQREAIRRALDSEMLILTGGPGTGKTTLVRAIVQIFTRKSRRVLLAAPTGRAAKRLSEATGVAAKTVHRLLEFDPHKWRFQRHRERPLEADLVVVDEASMLDCRLAHHLLEAVPGSARLLLVGDVDQLPSVGPGRVLADLIESGAVPLVRLEEIFRQAAESRIVANAHRIRRGQMPHLETRDRRADFFFIERREPEELLATVKHLVTERVPGGFGLDPRQDVQVLSPMRRGAVGADRLNRELQALLNPDGSPVADGRGGLKRGDRVMQVRNNYDLEVFNGDVGRVLDEDPATSRVRVVFDDRVVEYEPAALDELTLAYACSVHKSQGSEYPCVVVPIHTQHFVLLQRNLLYTAVTRGRKLVLVVGDRRAVEIAVRNARQAERFTRLAARLSDQRSSSGGSGSPQSPSGAGPGSIGSASELEGGSGVS